MPSFFAGLAAGVILTVLFFAFAFLPLLQWWDERRDRRPKP